MNRVEIGAVSRPHGVRGELRVHLYNPDSTALDVVTEVYIAGTPYAITSARLVKGGALLRVEGICDRDQAEALTKAPIEVLRDELELEEDDVLLDEFVGCQLLLKDGSEWGQVVEVLPGVQDLLVIHQGEIERYLPLVEEFLVKLDMEAQQIVVAPPADLPEWER